MFTKRYSKKLVELSDNDGILIDIFDAFARLKFVDYIIINKTKNISDVELLINKAVLTTSNLNDLLTMVNFVSHIDKKILKYKNDQMKLDS